MTYKGKPPVAAWSKLVSAAPRGRPEIASARHAVSVTSSGLRESSVSSPVARILTVQPASSGSSSRLSSRSVPATRICALADSPRQNVRNARVSWSHHCILSRTSSIGRPTASSARARPSKKRWRCQASAIALDPAPRCPRLPDGTSLSTSTRHAGLIVAAADWTAGFRTQSATGASASRPGVPKHWALATTAPCSRARSATSATRRVLPTPAPPQTSARLGRPAAAVRHSSWSRPSSADRPTSCAEANPERPAAVPVTGGSVPDGSTWASRRWSACRVAGSGTMPSSRSRIEAQ